MIKCSFEVGNSTCLYDQPWECKVAGKECLGLGGSMDIMTVSEQGRPWNLTKVEMRSQACRKIVSKKPVLLVGEQP